MYYQILEDLAKIIKNQKFWPLGPGDLKQGPRTKIFQLIYNLGPNIYIQPNFGRPSLDNKNFEILTFGARGLKTGAPNQNFSTDM